MEKAIFAPKEKVKCKPSFMKGAIGEIIKRVNDVGDKQQYAVMVGGQKMAFTDDEIELVPSGPMKQPIPVNRFCVCLKGKKENFKKGQKYFVRYLYQDPDGDFMAEVENEVNWAVRCYAKRFNIVGP